MFKKCLSIALIVLVLLYQVVIPLGTVEASSNASLLPPSNISYTNSSPDDVKLSWTAVYGATGYNIYEIKDGQMILLGKASSSSYSLSNLAEGAYRYVVSTLSADGESGPSAPVEFEIIYPEMQAPIDLKYTIRNGNDVYLSWGSSKYAEKYNVYQISESGEQTLLTSTNSTNYTQGKLLAGSYIYAVTTVNDLYGESAESDLVTAEVIHPIMEPPVNPSVTVSNGTDVTLKWTSSAFATSYNVYTIVGEELIFKQSVTGTTITFKNLPAGDYLYKVFSNSDRFGESSVGSDVSVTVGSIVMTEPTNVTSTIRNGNDVLLKWDAVPYATEYRIYETINGERTLKNAVKTTSVSYTKIPAGIYSYEVYSYSDRFGESEKGTLVTFEIDSVDVLPPTDLIYEIKNGNDIYLSWKAAENATSYNIYQIVDGEKVFKKNSTSTSTNLLRMASGDHHFEVHTNSDRFGESQGSAKITVFLEGINLDTPLNAKYVIKNGNDINLTWDSVENASEYKVYEVINGEQVLKTSVTGTSYTMTNVTAGNHTYVIHAYNSRFGESAEGSTVILDLIHPEMEAPKNIRFNAKSPTSFSLEWDSVEYVNSYKVYQIIEGQKVLKTTTSGTTVTYSNMKPGEYKYVVHSYSSRFGESKAGASIEETIENHALPAPEDVTANIVNGNSVTLKWLKVDNATNYNIYKKSGEELTFIRNTSGTTSTITNQPEGEFVFVVKANSTILGESPYASEVTGTITYPVMEKPADLTKSISNGNDLILRWKSVSHANSYNVYQLIDGVETLVRSTNSTSLTFANLPEGNYKYIVRSYSNSFGESPEGSFAEIDIVWPIMQAPANLKKSISNGNDIILSWSASEFANEYRIYQIIDGEEVYLKKTTGTSTSFTNMPEEDYQYKVYSYSNRFGESANGSEQLINLVWPVMQSPQFSYSIFDVNNIKFTWKKADYATKYRLYEVSKGSKDLVYEGSALTKTVYNLTEDTHSYVVTSISDRFGESAPSEVVTEKIVYPIMHPPTASLTLLSKDSARINWDFVTYANGYNIYEVIEGKSVLVAEKVNNLSYTLKNLSYANHEYYVTSYSNSFGESKESEIVLAKLIVDTEAPVTISDAPVAWVNKSQMILFEATDNEVGVEATYYSINEGEWHEGTSVVIEHEGVHEVQYYSTDKVGNVEEAKTAVVKIDKTAPVTEVNKIPEYVQAVTVQLTSIDKLSGVVKTYYSINDSEFVEGSSFDLEQNGIHEIKYYSLDATGNKEEIKSVTVKIDAMAPVTSVDAPNVWVNEDVNVNLTAKDQMSGVESTYYSINGSEFVEGTSFLLKDEGINTISFYSVDEVGNKEEVKTAGVKIDKTAPVTEVNEIPEYVQAATVQLTSVDKLSGVVKTYYSINDSEFVEGSSFDLEQKGIHEVKYYSLDAAGNKEEIQSVTVKIDATAPITSVDAPEVWINEDVNVKLNAKDLMSGVASTYYSINGSEFMEGTSFALKNEGIYTISFYSVDIVGNKEEVKTTEVKIDKSSPIVSADLLEEYELGTKLKLDFESKDILSGVSSETLTLNGLSYKKGSELTFKQPGVYTIQIEVIDAAGNKTVIEKTLTVYVPIELEVLPKVIKGNKGVFTVKANLPKEFQSLSFDVSSVFLNGVSPVVDNNGLRKQAEKGHFKFNREDFTWTTGLVTLELYGYVGDVLIKGKATVETKK